MERACQKNEQWKIAQTSSQIQSSRKTSGMLKTEQTNAYLFSE